MLQIIRAQVNERVQESSDPSQWLEIARNRVGGLFKLAVVGSSLLVDLDTPNDGSLEEIGGHYGVIFMIQDELLDLLGATKGALRGQSIREGKVTGLLNHFLHNADSESRDRVWKIFCRTSAETSDDDVAEVLDAMERQGTFRYAVDLIREQQEQVRAKSTTLDAKFMNALTSITEVFLKPLLDRLEP